MRLRSSALGGAAGMCAALVVVLTGCSSGPGGALAAPTDDAGAFDAAPPVDEADANRGAATDAALDGTVDGRDAEAPSVRFVGRVASGDGGSTRFEWPGVSVHARFTGPSVAMDIDDSNGSEFAVFVDGKEQPKVVAHAGRRSYPLASGLTDGAHELVVWRRSEAFVGSSAFYGLSFDATGALLAPPAPPGRRIEVVGDSITCGYGNEGAPGCTFSAATENNYLAYGSVAARLLGAELSTVAWSGLGIYRNYGDVGPSDNPLPSYYDDALPTTHTPWDFTRFVPDVVVIDLGTNDSSTHGDPGAPFVDAYVTFVRHVRAKYPDAFIVCIDANPIVTADVGEVVSTIASGHDTKIEAFAMTGQNGQGCDGHPNVASDDAMGRSLAAEIARVMGW